MHARKESWQQQLRNAAEELVLLMLLQYGSGKSRQIITRNAGPDSARSVNIEHPVFVHAFVWMIHLASDGTRAHHMTTMTTRPRARRR